MAESKSDKPVGHNLLHERFINYDGADLVFLVGCPRSGTTWLQKLLAYHNGIKTGQESDLFDDYIGPQLRMWRCRLKADVSGRGGVGLACYLNNDEFINALRGYMLNLAAPIIASLGPGELFLEKTPSHALFIPEIMELLPRARIIHLHRDARDVVASLLSASKSWGKHWAPRTAPTATRMWVEHVRAVRDASNLLGDGELFETGYDDLLSSPSQTLRALAGFLGLEWKDEEISTALQDNSPVNMRRGGGTRIMLHGEIAKGSPKHVIEPPAFIRQARSGGWKQDLSVREKFWVWILAHGEMKRLGYQWSLSSFLVPHTMHTDTESPLPKLAHYPGGVTKQNRTPSL